MSVHSVPIEWHDLIEDPEDLPQIPDGYWDEAFVSVTIRPKFCPEAFLKYFVILHAKYLKKYNVWICDSCNTNGRFACSGFGSGWVSLGFNEEAEYSNDDSLKFNDHFEVVAWTYPIEPYHTKRKE